MTDYPDLSKPLSSRKDYPDLSKPIASSQSKNTIDTMMGKMNRPDEHWLNDFAKEALSQESMRKGGGAAAMVAFPEVKLASLLPEMIASRLPSLSGGAKIVADYLTNVGKVGAGGYLGSKIMGADNKQSVLAGGIGAGVSAATIPLAMATSSLNPLVRLAAGSGLGSILGYGAGQMTGIPYSTAGGGVLGGLLGLRGSGAGQLAARNVSEALTPDQIATAQSRQAAGNQIGVPLTLAEKTGSPILGAMQQEAAMSAPGSKVLYPFGLKRGKSEESAYQRLLNDISPKGTKEAIEGPAYREAFNSADKNNVRVNVDNVINHIDEQLPKYEPGSKIAKALNMAKDRLKITSNTSQRQEEMLAPINQAEQQLQNKSQQIKQQIKELQSNAPDPYFAGSTEYGNQLSQLQSMSSEYDNALSQLNQQKQQFMQKQNISNYENTVEGLHNAKMGIRGIIEGQGENAIGSTAAGKLKQVEKLLNKEIKDVSPEYAAASRISNLRQVRDAIEDAMTKSNITGSNFYDKVLANRNEFDALYKRLADPNNPKVETLPQKNLKAMREAFPDLIDNLTAKSGKALADKGAEIGINIGGLTKSFLNKIYMDRYNKAVADLMINPKWEEELASVAKMKAGEDRGIRLGRLLSKSLSSGAIEYNSNN